MAASPTPESKLNLLLVDDQPQNLLALQAVLEPLGQNLVTANSGAATLRCVLEHEFAAILLDVQMPGMDGFETARLIRQRERCRHTPIIFVTATPEAMELAGKGYEAGAVDYLIKPVVPEFLRVKVQVFLDLAAARHQLETEIAERQRAERKILSLNESLEQRVRERTAELEAQRRRNEVILNSAGEGICGVDREGNISFANPAALELLGYTIEEVIGQPQHALIHHTRPDGSPYPREECPIYAASTDGKTHQVDDEVFWRKDGSSFPVEYSSNPMRDERDRLIGAVVIFKDITERKRVAEEFRALNADLERRVEERTVALREANETLKSQAAELKAFNQVMVDREQRIIEMKEEVNALCKELGRKPEYPPVWRKGPS
ncbi:MAG: response regulator [Verrucomicrobiota bacterium]